MVRASLIGAILANLLLAQGVAFLLGGLRYHNQEYNSGATRVYSSMMLIAVISLVVPSSFSRFFSSEATMRQEQLLNLGMAFVLLIAYGLYLLFMLKTHPEFFAAAGGQEENYGKGEHWGMPRAVGSLRPRQGHDHLRRRERLFRRGRERAGAASGGGAMRRDRHSQRALGRAGSCHRGHQERRHRHARRVDGILQDADRRLQVPAQRGHITATPLPLVRRRQDTEARAAKAVLGESTAAGELTAPCHG